MHHIYNHLADDIQSLQQQVTADTKFNDSDENHTEHDTELSMVVQDKWKSG